MPRSLPPLVRRIVLAFLILATLAGGAGALAVARSSPERTRAPRELADDAADALRRARSAGAAARAPLNLAHADGAYADGLLELRRQELRFRWLRDFRAARRTLERSVERAASAADVSRRSAGRDRDAAREAVVVALATLGPLAGAEERVFMTPALRGRLQRARTLAAEASTLAGAGAFGPAVERARESVDRALAVSSALHGVTSRYADDVRLRVWSEWVTDAVAWSRKTGRTALVVDKDAHRVSVYRGGTRLRVYDAELGWNNVGDKRHQGDGATPEGHYTIVDMKGRGRSRYHKALLLDYPNAEDLDHLARLKATGEVPRGTRAGGLIEIHGEGGKGKDWTDGCVAVANAAMDELFGLVAVGTPVTIVGSHAGDGVFAEMARRLQR